jgi:diguanylate cyclase (GGDEF)-like protein
MISGYFGVTAVYYIVMTLVHFRMHSGAGLPLIVIASTSASIVFTLAWYAHRNAIALARLHIVITIANLFMLTNVMVAMESEFAPENLVYFIIMVMMFALACTSITQALVSIAAVLVGLFYVLLKHAPELLTIYGFITFSASMSSISITYFMRRALGLTAFARYEAENRLHEAEKLGEEMRQRSLSDSLTGLPNRRAFFEALKRSKQEAASGRAMWLVLLDLDGFKAVNDGYGHLIGDALLKAVATRMQDYCGAEAHLSRMGGDEFNIILPGIAKENAVETWCQGLLDHVAEVYLIEDRLIQISASIGCHQIFSAENDIQLVRDADYALLYAKKHGKNRVVVFQDEHAKVAAEHFRIEQALRAADFDSEIELLFQPQIDLTQNRIVRAEALARWSSPIIGDIMPGRFIEVAEESGLIANITLAVLKKAIAALKNWPDPIPLSINLSGHDLISDPIINQIIDQVKISGLNPALLEFEVTETAMMADTSKASSNMLRLSARGHPLALDDFGTGYSNFNYLRTLPISKLKVDRSFMKNVADPMTEKILQSLVGMARTLGVDCLLEGVEDELQLLMAKRVGTHMVQGYLFGMPMTAMELLSHLEERNMVGERHIKRLAVGG